MRLAPFSGAAPAQFRPHTFLGSKPLRLFADISPEVVAHMNNQDPHAVFRVRDKERMKLRRNRRGTDMDSWKKLFHLRADLVGHAIRVTDIQPGLAHTEFSLVRYKGDADKAEVPYEGVDPLTAADIAESVSWCIDLPEHVCINRLEIMPTMQAPAGVKVVKA